MINVAKIESNSREENIEEVVLAICKRIFGGLLQLQRSEELFSSLTLYEFDYEGRKLNFGIGSCNLNYGVVDLVRRIRGAGGKLIAIGDRQNNGNSQLAFKVRRTDQFYQLIEIASVEVRV